MEQTNQNQNMRQFVCNGDCKKCRSTQQWSFCASVHAYSNMKVLDKVMETLTAMQAQADAIQGTVQELAARVTAIQDGEAAVFDPAAHAAAGIPVAAEGLREETLIGSMPA